MSAFAEIARRLTDAGVPLEEVAELIARAAVECAAKIPSSGALRTAKWRDKKRHGDVTPSHEPERHKTSQSVTVTSPVTAALSLKEDSSQKERKRESRAAPRASRIPPDWKPDLEFARKQGLSERDIEVESQKFRNYWTAKGGKDAAKLDWPATWENWILRVCEQRGLSPIVTTENPEDAAHGWRPGMPTSAELEAKYAGQGEGNRLVENAPVAQAGVRVRREDQGVDCDQGGIEGARSLGSLLPGLGLHAGDVPRAGGRSDVDGAVPVAGMDEHRR